MNPAGVALRHSRGVLLVTPLLVAAGALASFSLPSNIYPPLEFPRIVVIAHAGSLPGRSMTLTVARPLEQAIMEVAGIRRVRSRSFRGATEISAQFEPGTDTIIALQQVQERVAELRGQLPADIDIQIDRQTPAVFPIWAINLTGAVPAADLRLRFYVVRPACRSCRRRRVSVLASDTRDRGHRRSVEDARRETDGGRRRRRLEGCDQLQPVSHYPAAASGIWCWLPVWQSLDDIAAAPIVVRTAPRFASRTSGPCSLVRRTGRRSSQGRAATRPPSACPSRSARIFSRSDRASRPRSTR
jgi:hypothetical protein